MALRLRRGTNAQRALITPAEGELIYVTDTNEIYVGDGTTVGGIRITGEVVNELAQLNDVDAALPQDGDILQYDSPTGDWVSGELPLDDLSNVITVGIQDGQVLVWNESAQAFLPGNNAFSNTFTGDIIGSVFGDDSTLLIDSVNNVANLNTINNVASIDIRDTVGSPTDVLDLNFPLNSNGSVALHAYQDTPLSNNFAGTLSFVVTDTVESNQLMGYISATNQRIHLVCDPNGSNHGYSKGFRVFADGSNASLGPLEAREGLTVTGGEITGDLVGSLFTDASTMLIDGITGSLMIANVDIVGETGNAPVDTGVDGWLEVTVNGATKYIPLYD